MWNIEQKLNQIFDSEVKLKSGGYLVINPTEALVSIDINSGSSIKGKNVEKVLEDEPGYYGWIQNADFPLYTKKVLTAIKLRKLNNKLS